MNPIVKSFFDPATFSLSYLVSCPETKKAIIIDPVLDFDPAAMKTDTASAQKIISQISQDELDLAWILETHAHADHLSAAQYLKQSTGAPIAIGKEITQVQSTFNQLFELSGRSAASASDFDRLLADGDRLSVGSLTIEVMHTPGHTPTCCTYVIGDAAFVGDTIFMPDFGTARCDFPGGDAKQLYQSLQKTLSLPAGTRLFMCHDYMPGGRELAWETTVETQKATNIHIKAGTSEAEFVKMRTERDKQLPVPKLILPSLQINIRAGKLPEESESGTRFIKLPLNKL